jgi:hypothetical protein
MADITGPYAHQWRVQKTGYGNRILHPYISNLCCIFFVSTFSSREILSLNFTVVFWVVLLWPSVQVSSATSFNARHSPRPSCNLLSTITVVGYGYQTWSLGTGEKYRWRLMRTQSSGVYLQLRERK